MPINKYDRLGPQKDWSWQGFIPKLPEVNFDLLSQTLEQQQSQFDLARTISEKQPQVLQTEGDLALYNQYKQMVDTGLQSVTDAYANKGAAEGSRAYREYVNGIRKAWQPNGVASALTDRYTSYYNAKKQIDDFYKDDPRNVNKTLSIKALQDQLNNPIDYQDGKYNQIVTPQTYKDPDFRKAINDMIKQIDDSGDTTFLGDRNKSWWIEKIKTTGRPEDKIRLATQALSEQPEFAAQIQRDAQYQALSIDPDKYQSNFNFKLDKQLSNLEQQLNGKQGKEILEQQGYDTSDLKKAKKEFLADQKSLAQQKKDSFDLNTELSRDITNDYMNYASGFASQKIDKDLIYNKKLADQAKIQASRERTQALLSVSDNLIQREGPSATVTTGVAQQLPELDKHYTDLKTKQSELKSGIDKSLNSPGSTFNGWKMEDVAAANNLWKSTMSKLPANASEQEKQQAFSNALQASGSYQWKPDQLQKVYQEFSSVNGSSIAPAFTAYQETQNEIERVDNARTYVAGQYINTPEGKESFNMLKGFRKPNETDEQLVQRALSNPEQFEIKGAGRFSDVPMSGGYVPQGLRNTNAAQTFNSTMQRDIKSQTKNGAKYDWGDMATYQVGFNKGDKSFLQVGNSIGSAITNGTQYQFSSEGKQGLTFRDANGDVIKNVSKVDMGDFVVGKNSKGQPVINYKATVTPEGGKAKDAVLSIDIVAGSPEWEQIKGGLEGAYIAKINAGEEVSANAVLDLINTVEKGVDLNDASTQVMVNNLNRSKVKPLNDILVPDASGALVPASYKGYSGIDTKNTYETIDPQTGATMTYETYGLMDQSGNKYVAEVYIAPNGQKVMTNIKSNMSSITQDRLGKKIIAKTPVERETVKLPQGQVVNLTNNVIQANEQI